MVLNNFGADRHHTYRRKAQAQRRRNCFWGGFGPEQVEQRILLTVSPFYKTISIDGDFSDWDSIAGYTDPTNNTHDTDHNQSTDTPAYVNHPDVDLIGYKAAYDDNNLYFYFKSTGIIGRTQQASPGHAAGRYYVIVTMDVDQNDTTGYNLYEGGYFPSTKGYDMNSEIEFYDGTFNSGNYLNHGALNQTELNQAFLDQSQGQYVAGNDGPYPAGFVDIKPGTYKYYDEWVYHNDDTITFVRDKGPVVLGVIQEAISADGHELEMIVPYVGFLKDSSGNPIVGLGSTLDLSFSLEASGELAPGGQWASNTAAPINGFALTPPTYPPTDITLDNDTVAENEPNAIVGGLFSTDPDTTAPYDFTYEILPGGDAAEFELSGDSLIVGPTGLNYEAGSTRTVTIRSTDIDNNYFDKTFTINVTDVNEAPILTRGKATLPSIPMNLPTSSNPGMLVSDFLKSLASTGGSVTDPDLGALKGIAVTQVDQTNGVWQYATNGTNWANFGSVDATTARLLDTNDATRIRFVSNFNYVGTSSFLFTAWDRTIGFNGATAIATNRGGSKPFSLQYDKATINVYFSNVAPVLDPAGKPTLTSISRNVDDASNTGTLVSDIIANLTSSGGSFTDGDLGAVQGIAVTKVDNTNGTWQYSLDAGANWINFGVATAGDARLLASNTNSKIRFVPNLNYFGTATFVFVAWDQTSGKNGSTMGATTRGGSKSVSLGYDTASINVTFNNAAPTLNSTGKLELNSIPTDITDALNDGVSVTQLLANQVAVGGGISDADVGAVQGIAVTRVDDLNGTWQYTINGGTDWYDFGTASAASARLLSADANTKIRFRPIYGYVGPTSFLFVAWDQTTGTNGGTGVATKRGGSTPFSTGYDLANLSVTPFII